MSCVAEPKTYIDYFVAFTPITISLSVALVAWLQWRLSNKKLLADMYERRFSVYENTVVFYWVLMRDNDLVPLPELLSAQDNFLKSWRESQFLFKPGDGINEILDTFRMQTNPFVDRRKGLNVQQELYSEKLESHLMELELRIWPYLNLTKWGIPNGSVAKIGF